MHWCYVVMAVLCLLLLMFIFLHALTLHNLELTQHNTNIRSYITVGQWWLRKLTCV